MTKWYLVRYSHIRVDVPLKASKQKIEYIRHSVTWGPIQLPYETSVALPRCPLVLIIMHGGPHPPIKLESFNIAFTVCRCDVKSNQPKNIYFKVKLPVLTGSLSAIQPYSHPLTFNFPWSLDNISIRVSWRETISLPVLTAANIRRPGILNLHRHGHLWVPINTYRVEPRRFISCAQSNPR